MEQSVGDTVEVSSAKSHLKLYHRATLIGLVKEAGANGFEMQGCIELTSDAEKYKALFKYWTDPKLRLDVDPPFPEEMLHSWFIETEAGERKEIGLPGIYEDEGSTDIIWRYF